MASKVYRIRQIVEYRVPAETEKEALDLVVDGTENARGMWQSGEEWEMAGEISELTPQTDWPVSEGKLDVSWWAAGLARAAGESERPDYSDAFDVLSNRGLGTNPSEVRGMARRKHFNPMEVVEIATADQARHDRDNACERDTAPVASDVQDTPTPDPRPTVQLLGRDGNAFSILGAVQRAFKQIGRPDLAEKYLEEAMGGDYNHLLQVTMRYCEVD